MSQQLVVLTDKADPADPEVSATFQACSATRYRVNLCVELVRLDVSFLTRFLHDFAHVTAYLEPGHQVSLVLTQYSTSDVLARRVCDVGTT